MNIPIESIVFVVLAILIMEEIRAASLRRKIKTLENYIDLYNKELKQLKNEKIEKN